MLLHSCDFLIRTPRAQISCANRRAPASIDLNPDSGGIITRWLANCYVQTRRFTALRAVESATSSSIVLISFASTMSEGFFKNWSNKRSRLAFNASRFFFTSLAGSRSSITGYLLLPSRRSSGQNCQWPPFSCRGHRKSLTALSFAIFRGTCFPARKDLRRLLPFLR